MGQLIRFCTAPDGTQIAYSVAGNGPPLVKTANFLSHLEADWDSPVKRHFLQAFSKHNMLVCYDERGTGLSDWDAVDLSFDAWVSDLETVVDAAGLEKFDLYGQSQGGPVGSCLHGQASRESEATDTSRYICPRLAASRSK